MKIAITYDVDNGMVGQHFGHTEAFKVYELDGAIVKSADVVSTNGSGHSLLAGMLAEMEVDVLICGGIGGGAKTALSEAGIQIFGGVQGDADDALVGLLTGTLQFDPDVRCSHHDDVHGDEAHECGEHGCGAHEGGHSCGGGCGHCH